MVRYLLIFAIAAAFVLFVLDWGYRAYGITLSPAGLILRTVGGVVVAAVLAWRWSNMLPGKKKPREPKPGPVIYQRPTADQIAGLGGKIEQADPGDANEQPVDAPSSATLRDRLRQKTDRN